MKIIKNHVTYTFHIKNTETNIMSYEKYFSIRTVKKRMRLFSIGPF